MDILFKENTIVKCVLKVGIYINTVHTYLCILSKHLDKKMPTYDEKNRSCVLHHFFFLNRKKRFSANQLGENENEV